MGREGVINRFVAASLRGHAPTLPLARRSSGASLPPRHANRLTHLAVCSRVASPRLSNDAPVAPQSVAALRACEPWRWRPQLAPRSSREAAAAVRDSRPSSKLDADEWTPPLRSDRRGAHADRGRDASTGVHVVFASSWNRSTPSFMAAGGTLEIASQEGRIAEMYEAQRQTELHALGSGDPSGFCRTSRARGRSRVPRWRRRRRCTAPSQDFGDRPYSAPARHLR